MYDSAASFGLGAFLSAYWGLMLLICILLIIAQWKIFEKAGEAGWKSLIPFYNMYILYKIAWGNGWLFLLTIIPIVGIVAGIVVEVKLSKAFGQGGGFAVGLILLPNVFQLILGFGHYDYIGPNGEAPAAVNAPSANAQ